MIEPLTQQEGSDIYAQLSLALPAQLLSLIARTAQTDTPLTTVSLCSQVRRYLPVAESDLVYECLNWLDRHGDIERGRAGRLTCPPPYLVLGSEGDTQRHGLLLGSPLYDDSLQQEFRDTSYKVQVIQDSGRAVGWERRLTFPAGSILTGGSAKLLCIELSKLQNELPSLRQVYIPPQPATVPTWGFWECYHPGGKWQQMPETQAQENQLWRWRSSEADRPEQGRYFVTASGLRSSRFRELFSLNVAWLWCHYLDHHAGQAQRTYRRGETLYVPRTLPGSVERWLFWEQQLAENSADSPLERWSNAYRRYKLSSSTIASTAQRLLEERLGLQPEQGVPT